MEHTKQPEKTTPKRVGTTPEKENWDIDTNISRSAPRGFQFNLIDAKDLYECDLPPISYLISKYVCEASLIYYAGSPGTFKTGIAINMAICGALGLPFLDVNIDKPFNTLFIDEENGLRRTKTKFDRLVDGMNIKFPPGKVTFSTISGFKINQPWIDTLRTYITKHKVKLIIIDNIARCLVGSERDEKDVSKIHNLLKPLIEEYGVSIIIIHHLTKGEHGRAKTLNDIRGSGDFGGQCDEAFLLDKFRAIDDISQIFKLSQLKIKDGQEIKSINIKVSGDIRKNPPDPLLVEFDGYIEDKKEEKLNIVYSDILTFFIDEKINTMKTQKIKDVMHEKYKHSKHYVDRALKKLCDDKMFVNKPYGSYTVKK